MSNAKKSGKSKFLAEDLNDFITKSQYVQESPKNVKPLKRTKPPAMPANPAMQEQAMSKLMVDYQGSVKKRKMSQSQSMDVISQKVQDTVAKQIGSRQKFSDLMLSNLSDILTQLDADCTLMKENQEKLEQLTGALLKCIQQSNAAQQQKLKSLWDMHATFKKGVEGLITRGAMKPDDRPVWFDVYKAFPPLTEPKFAKPLPEIKPIRPILYEEDVVRAKFHSSGQGFGVINMLSPTGETPIKKLVKQYEKLKSEGVPENELVEKASAAVDTQWQQDSTPKTIAKNPDSVTAQVLAEADLKTIFKEK